MTEFARDWIAKREDLEQAATDGPWVREWDTADQWWTIHGQPNPAKGDDRMVCPEVATLNHREDWTSDADIIVAARTALPAALAALRAVLEEEGPRATGYYSEYSVGYHDALDACRDAIEAALRGES